MRDRSTNRAGVERPRAHRSSIMRSLSDSMMAGAALIACAFRESVNPKSFRVAIAESDGAKSAHQPAGSLVRDDGLASCFSCSAARRIACGDFDANDPASILASRDGAARAKSAWVVVIERRARRTSQFCQARVARHAIENERIAADSARQIAKRVTLETRRRRASVRGSR
jgi:hypothetical protein